MTRLVVFDLDGTLIDSKLDIAHAVNAARRRMNLPDLSLEQISSYVGDGAPVLIRRALGPDATGEQVSTALAFFIEYYDQHRVDHTVIYPGVRETLEVLSNDRVLMAVLTNKPVRISKRILDDLELSKFFQQTYGGNSFENKKPHPIGIDTLRSELEAERHETVMVGDSGVDVQTARNAGVASVGVTFGFAPESLVANPPDFLLDHMQDLLRVLEQRDVSLELGAPAMDLRKQRP